MIIPPYILFYKISNTALYDRGVESPGRGHPITEPISSWRCTRGIVEVSLIHIFLSPVRYFIPYVCSLALDDQIRVGIVEGPLR